MALFKISKGLKANLPSAKTAGYCWYTTDDSLFYIDYEDENGIVQRQALNAKEAETLMGASLATVLSNNELEIPTSAAVWAALANKADASHTHDNYSTTDYVDSAIDAIDYPVDSVNGKTGAVVLSAGDVGAPTVDEMNAAIAAIPTPDVSGQINTHNTNTSAHTDIRERIDDVEDAIPAALSDLSADANHRTVTDAEKATWNAKSNFSGNYNDLTNKPSIPSITGLATVTYVDEQLATKADSTHNHDGAYDTKGAAAGVQENLDTVSDALDSHTGDSNIHVTAAKKTNWDAAYTHSQSAHARTDATKVADSTTNGNILINGTETNVYTHPSSGVTAGTYKSVTVNAQGHVTGGSNPTTLAGYGITDAESKGAASSALSSAKEYTDSVASGKADKTHNHDSSYDAKGAAASALADAKVYADGVKNDLLNGAGGAYDTLKELGDLIDDNKDAIDALEEVAAGKADKTHSHAISDVTGLQGALDGKAASSHGTHVNYSATDPAMDGTASPGSASTVARSDHKHPTDTSRAAKADLDTHVADTTKHITSTERTNWGTAYTHSQAAHAPSNAQPNQNAFSNVKVGSTTVAADTTTDTLEFAGSNVTITPDATNDKITFAVADGSTSTKGIVQLTNSTSSTSTTTAATPSSVKSAYDLANTAKTNAATAQSRADAAYSLAEGKVDSLSDLGITATAEELNYMDGVTSGVQSQLDGKAASGHTHKYAGSSSAGGAATSANKVANSLTVKLNGGTTEGTNLFTFNGSAAKSVNITAASIGAAASSHTHDDRYYTESEIDTKVSTLNTAINGKAESSHTHTIANITNLQSTLDGKASSSHNHAASNITSGTLSSDRLPTVPIAKGGTGATTAAAALTNLGITASAAELNIMDGVTATTAEINKLDGVTATTTELNYVDGVTSNIQTQLNSKLGKTTYEYNTELALGGTGKVCIGKFPMYDSNISVEIKSTTNTTYNGTLIIATQNINTTGGGSYTATVYGDASNSLTGAIKIHYGSGSNVFSVYIDLPGWSKNLLHIQCVALAGAPTDIATTVTEIPSNATIVPTNALKAQLDTKQANITGGASTIAASNLTASRALISNSSGKVAVSDVTSTELGYLDGVTSAIQTQLDGKAASGHTHNYAGSSSAGGAATSANKVNKSLTVQLNGGTTEGTNKFTFDGSAAKSMNITASSVGAAASSHTHDDRYYTESEIDSKVSTLNTAISGKAASSHTHSYLPLSGGTLTGDLEVQDGLMKLSAGVDTALFSNVDGSNRATLILGVNKSENEKIRLETMIDGTLKQYKIYGEHNKPTAADVGAASSSHDHLSGLIQPAALELTPASTSVNNGGYIDFHYNASTADYTSRIIENSSGNLRVYGTSFQVPDAVPTSAYSRNILARTASMAAGDSMTSGRICLIIE